jgi:site-specific DNA-methyltransferase (adenine-specific)
MTHYYRDEYVTLYLGDCREVTEWLNADVLVTDPPYGMNYSSGFRPVKERIIGDGDNKIRDEVLQRWQDGPAIVFGTWRMPAPPNEKQRLIWWKRGCGFIGNLDIPWGTSHEDIYILGSGWDVAETGMRRAPSVLVTDVSMGGRDGIVAGAGHPTAKPVGLMVRLIQSCPPGIIADPFAGSGPTLLAARQLGRKSIGVEIEERYCELIARRLSQAELFVGAV